MQGVWFWSPNQKQKGSDFFFEIEFGYSENDQPAKHSPRNPKSTNNFFFGKSYLKTKITENNKSENWFSPLSINSIYCLILIASCVKYLYYIIEVE